MFDSYRPVKEVLVVAMNTPPKASMEASIETAVNCYLGRDCTVWIPGELDHRPAVLEALTYILFLGPFLGSLDDTIHEIVALCAARELALLVPSQREHSVEVVLAKLMSAARGDTAKHPADEARHL
ncbi:hypothetical protein NUW58_g10335 [Xylaria curta]|uniref:Uncharacterized protein n=1 Tax=Xylaria curta TaxID=42375 RepID=A0ACC1MLU3_9PEZI|nr:hypothetical protein NUW58_g10335 [Xylaria curta]